MERIEVRGATKLRGWQTGILLALVVGTGVSGRASDTFLKPTPEELAMTSVPGYPGASAVYLFREEIADDNIKTIQRYERIKILNEDGKKLANVELNYVRTFDTGSNYHSNSNEETVGDIVGRTIHADGTIIPFTGKPYEKTIEKTKGYKYQARVFTLPEVEVGSIIEYRYATRYNDYTSQSPNWYIQGEYFIKAAHYKWLPTTRDLVDNKQRPINSISWFPILPAGVQVVHTTLPQTGLAAPRQIYEVTVKDISPIVKEEYMPPLRSYSYRVLFNFTSYRSGDEYWKSEGKEWAKRGDAFMKQSKEVQEAAQAAVADAPPDQKLKKIYAKVMTLENTDYTRTHEKQEDGKLTNNVTDVLNRGRGSSSQLTELFVAMARAAGYKSYLMLVPDTSEGLFTPNWLSFRQFDAEIAIVNVDGKDQFFDPGSRYCAFGHLEWQHTFVQGLRQTDSGTDFGSAPGDGYLANRTTRVANLNMDEKGEITGKIDLTFTGQPSLRWRHTALRGDEEAMKDGLRKMLEEMVPRSLEVKVADVKNVTTYEEPLQVSYEVHGTLGTATGKRLVMPVNLFESGSVATFADAKRETAVDFQYAQSIQDALRVNFNKGFEVEAKPGGDKYEIPKRATYAISVESTPTSFTTRRGYVMGDVIFPSKEYSDLRTFYTKIETKDKESVVLKVAPVATALSGGQ